MISRISSIKRTNTTHEPLVPTRTNHCLKQPICRVGNEYIWKLYQSYTVDTNEEYSVFVLEKKTLEKTHRFSNKRDALMDSLKRDVMFLEKFKHAQILRLTEGLEESRDFLTFVSEPIFGCLNNFIRINEKWTFPIPKHIKNYKFYDLEVILGLYQIIDALRFLNITHEMVHGNINPNNIIICKHGHWKLTGFQLAEKITDSHSKSNSFISRTERAMQTDLDFTAPEVQKNGKATPFSDMFSLGLVIASIYNNGVSPIQCFKSFSTYTKRLDELPTIFNKIAENIPRDLIEPLRKLLSIDVKYRPTPQLISMLKCFNEPFVKSLETLLSLEYKSMNQKKTFFNSFSRIVADYPKDIRYHRILPLLMEWFQQSEILASFVLPSILTILHKSTEDEFQNYFAINIKYIIKSEKNIQTNIVLLDLIEFFISRLTDAVSINELINTVFHFIEDRCPEAQTAAMNALPVVQEYLNTKEQNNILLTKLTHVVNSSTNPKVQLAMIDCVEKLLDTLDRESIIERIIPVLLKINLSDPSNLMATLDIYRHIITNNHLMFPYTIIANKILPTIIPLTVDSNLSIQEFRVTIDTVRIMLDKIERSRFNQLKPDSGAFIQNGSSSSMGSMYSSCRIPLIAMQQPTVDHDMGPRRNSGNYHSYQDILNKRSMSGDYSRQSFDGGISKSALLMNRLRSASQVSENFLCNGRNVSNSSTPDRRPWNKTNSNPSFNVRLSTTSRDMSSAQSLQILRRHSSNLPVRTESCSRNSVSLVVPDEYNPRRHSYGSPGAASVNCLITANICEGPFITPPGSRVVSRRTSAQSLGPTVVPNIPQRQPLPPVIRRSSFNNFSDSVFNFFNQAKP